MILALDAVPLVVALALAAGQDGAGPVRPVAHVDLARYAGRWHEIARFPNRFQAKCVGETTADYDLLPGGDIRVVNACRKADGSMARAEGRARLASPDGRTSTLKVRFAPAFLSFLPFVWGDYWIIVLAPDYSYVVIGEPDRKYLWILSRTPSMDEALLQTVFAQISEKGYDVNRIVRTQNSAQ